MGPTQVYVTGAHPLLRAVMEHLHSRGYEIVAEPRMVDKHRPVFILFGAEARDEFEAYAVHKHMQDMPAHADAWPVLLLSSSSVYGDRHFDLTMRKVLPSDESHGHVITSPLDPSAIRPLTALLAENFFVQRQTGSTIVVRPFNVYGPGVVEGVVQKLVNQAVSGVPLSVHAPGRQTRTFLYVSDFLSAIDGLLPKLLHGGRGIYNVGTQSQVELLSLAKSIGHAYGLPIKIAQVADADRHVWWKLPDITRVKIDAKWAPTVSLRSGLFRMAGRG